MPLKNNPLAPFIKGDFLKSPLDFVVSAQSNEKGDSGGCLVCYDTNFEIPPSLVQSSPIEPKHLVFFIADSSFIPIAQFKTSGGCPKSSIFNCHCERERSNLF